MQCPSCGSDCGYTLKGGCQQEFYPPKNAAYWKRRAKAAEARIENAPTAMMDTRTALVLCALAEEDFPGLYALQGKRVRIVVDA